METTDLTFAPNCPSTTPRQTDHLEDPVVTFQIRNQTCLLHDNHLSYTDSSGTEHHEVHIATLEVPAQEVKVIINWRAGETELIRHAPDTGVELDDSTSGQTGYVFTVPETGELDWDIDNGSPGFHLAIKVKRK